MIQIIQNLLSRIKLLPLSLIPQPLVLIRVTEKFDVVERVPVYARIRM
jgi:hypothetical protein